LKSLEKISPFRKNKANHESAHVSHAFRNLSLTLACLSFFRACIKPDDYYLKRIQQKDVLDKVLDLYKYNSKRQNLLSSSIFSVFHEVTVHATISKAFITYVGSRYLGDLEQIYPNTFLNLRDAYNKIMEKSDKVDPELGDVSNLPSDDEDDAKNPLDKFVEPGIPKLSQPMKIEREFKTWSSFRARPKEGPEDAFLFATPKLLQKKKPFMISLGKRKSSSDDSSVTLPSMDEAHPAKRLKALKKEEMSSITAAEQFEDDCEEVPGN